MLLFFFKDEINLPLAIEDYVPVIFFAIGLFFVATFISNRNKQAGKLAFWGGILVTLGGLFKASWKLIQALGGSDIPFLNNSLFVLLSSGFICVAWALWQSRADKSGGSLWSIPIILILILLSVASYIGFFTESRAWFFILLGATTLANLALLFQLMYHAFRSKLWLAIGLFIVNLVVIFALARSADQTVTMQWIKQIITTISQGSFALACWLLYKQSVNKSNTLS